MPILNTTAEAIRALLSLVPHVPRLIAGGGNGTGVPNIRGSGAVRVRGGGGGIIIHVDPPPPPPPGGGGPYPILISSFTSFGTNQWDYQGQGLVADPTLFTGFRAVGPMLELRNRWESLVMAGYAAGSVTGLRAIPAGAIVWCFGPVKCPDGKQRLIFSERNEPIC
jgi:hypothetical protein